jgi:TP901 family phage tail tape measure protein
MAGPRITVDVAGNTRPLERDINRIANKKVNLSLDSKNFSQPLGKIKGDLGEFDKSLAASNARVLAFGASAGAIYAVQKALSETVRATIEVEKSLAEVNVILGTSQKKLAGFGNELFNIAKRTGRSFQDVAIAGGELARQGLAMEETLKRTSDAMVLARLSGLGVEESVNAITAALNGFRNAALDSTAVVDKLIAVDQAFAVSGADLAEALRRVGSTAEGAGVSLDELLGIVTAAQQITARGGAVIGNSFKTIFTRIQRPRVLEALDDLGVKTKNASGANLSAINVLRNLAGTFDTLTQAQQAQIAELVGGVFQINVLKASLSDLGSQYSVFTNATEIAGRASGESARRNAELNKTLAAGLNETLQNLTKLGAAVGKLTLEPAIRNVLDIINAITEKISLGDAESKGEGIGKALLGGLGKFISGPGLALAASVLFKLFNDLRKFAADAFRTFSGLNASFAQQQQLQQGIVNILKENPKVLAQIQRGEISVDTAAKQILGSYKGLNAELIQMNNLASQLAGKMSQAGASVRTVAGVQTIAAGGRPKASGFVPNFANGGEAAAMALSGMYSGTQVNNPRTRRGRVFDGRGGSFMATYNAYEKKQDVIGPNGRKGTVISSPAMQAAARGFIPNFANAAIRNMPNLNAGMLTVKGKDGRYQARPNASDLIDQAGQGQFQIKQSLIDGKNIKAAGLSGRLVAARNQQRKDRQDALNIPTVVLPQNKTGIFTTGRSVSTRATMDIARVDALKTLGAAAGEKRFAGLDGLKIGGMFQASMNPIKGLGSGSSFDSLVERELDKPLQNIVKGMVGGSFGKGDQPQPLDVWKRATQDTSGYPQFIGRIFETAINSILGRSPAKSGTWDYLGGVDASSAPQQELYDNLFGKSRKLVENAQFLDAKRSGFGEPATRTSISKKIGNTPELSNKILRELNDDFPKMAQGYVPNFAGGLRDAIRRESLAGVSKGAMRVGQDRRLANKGNPLGLAVTNTRDEPRGIKDVLARGYVPNFVGASQQALGNVGASSTGDISKETNDVKNSFKNASNSANNASRGFEKVFGITTVLSLATGTLASATQGASEGTQMLTNNINALVSGVSVAAIAITTLSGGVGIAVGAIAGLATAAFAFQFSLTESQSKMKQYGEALDAAAVSLQEQGNDIQQAQQALSSLTDALSGGDAEQVQAAQAKYATALSKLPTELRNKLLQERDSTKRQQILGEAAGKVGKKTAANQEAKKTNELLQKLLEQQAKAAQQGTIIKVLAGIAALVAAILLFQKGKTLARSGDRLRKAGGGFRGALKLPTKSMGFFGKALRLGASALKTLTIPFLKLAGIAALAMQGISLLGTGLSKLTSETSLLGRAARFLSKKFDILGSVIGAIKARRGTKEARENLSSERYIEPGKEEFGITDEGRAKRKEDAKSIVNAIGRQLSDEEQEKIRKAGAADLKAGGTENLQKVLEELGLTAEQAGSFIQGAGSQVYGLALDVSTLSKEAAEAAAQTARLQAALDAQAAAANAAQAAIEQAASRNLEFIKSIQLFATNVQKAKRRQKEFTKELTLAGVKGGAELAKQFQTSFQSTKLEGDIAQLEINQKAGVKQEQLRVKGSKEIFDAVSKFGPIAKALEATGQGGAGGAAAQTLFANLGNALIQTSAQGGGATAQALQDVINQATGKGGALQGQKIDIANIDGIQSLLTQQLGEMARAEQTRLEQLRMQGLQTRLAQAQNKIDQELKAGGGIKAFLNPKQLDEMESGFNNAVKGFKQASGRGDSVKTGQFAGQLLSNLNEFIGTEMMGEGADGLKDLVQSGLEQSLRGRAMARAAVLEQAASETGNQDLAKAAEVLRNQDYGSVAATQVAAEFKRQKMPDNIASLLGLQQQLNVMQQQDVVANQLTAQNTAQMLEELSGGKFAEAAANVIANIPLGDALEDTEKGIAAMTRAMIAIPAAIATEFANIEKAKEIKDLQTQRGEKAVELDELIKKAQEDGQITLEEAKAIEKLTSEIQGIDVKSGNLLGSLSEATLKNFDPATAAMINERARIGGVAVTAGGQIDPTALSPDEIKALGPLFGAAVQQLQDIRDNFNVNSLEEDGVETTDTQRAFRKLRNVRSVAIDSLQGAGGATEARNFLMDQVGIVQRGVGRGTFDREQAALQLQGLQELLKRLDQGTLGTKASSDEEFQNQLLAQLENQTVNNQISIVIDPKIAVGGAPEVINLQADVNKLKQQLGAGAAGPNGPRATTVNVTSAGGTSPTNVGGGFGVY